MKEKRYKGKPGPYCGRCPYRDQNMVPGYGPKGAKYMILGEAPGLADARSGRCFTGLPGQRLQKQLANAKLFLSDCWVGNVVRCPLCASKQGGKKPKVPTKTALKCCRPLLEEEMAECGPSIIITLGAAAFNAFYEGQLKAYHGARIQGEGYELIPMFKPDAFDENPDLLRTIHADYRGLQARPLLESVAGSYSLGPFKEPANDRYSVDTETTGLDLRSKLLGMAVSEDVGEGVYVPEHLVPVRNFWPGHAVMHNAKYDLGILQSNGITPAETGWEDVDDTLLLAYCMNRKPLGLKPLAIQELQLEQKPYTEIADKNKSLVGVDPEVVAQYAGADSDLTLRLWYYLWGRSTARERRLYEEIEKPLPPLFATMQLRGVHVDVGYFEKMARKLEKELTALTLRITRTDGCSALTQDVLSSPTRLSMALSHLLRMRVGKTDKFALEKLKGRHPAVEIIMQWRIVHTLLTSFVNSILKLQRGGMVYPEFNQTGTSTSRMSCNHPNLQQLPKREDESSMRRGFPAPPGFVVVTIDNSQIDLRSLAYLSQDEEMLRVFREGLDMHDETVNKLIHGDGLTPTEMRRLAKVANFLVVFGGGAGALATKTGIDEDVAYDFMSSYWDAHPGVKNWVEGTHESLKKNGYVETAYGFRRYIPKVYTREQGAALREGQNLPVQGTSAGVLKLQTQAVVAANTGALPFGQIHDEIDFYVPTDHWKERVRELVKAMESVDCPFDLKVEASAGPTLGDQEKVVF